jgi:hypothetical protein
VRRREIREIKLLLERRKQEAAALADEVAEEQRREREERKRIEESEDVGGTLDLASALDCLCRQRRNATLSELHAAGKSLGLDASREFQPVSLEQTQSRKPTSAEQLCQLPCAAVSPVERDAFGGEALDKDRDARGAQESMILHAECATLKSLLKDRVKEIRAAETAQLNARHAAHRAAMEVVRANPREWLATMHEGACVRA